jgi:hypothetical protein
MAELPAHLNFWRYPVKASTAPDLDYRGKKKPIYPVKKFTKKECRAYVIEEWRGQYDGLIENKTKRGYPGLKHTESRKMEAYRRRLNPALQYLSPRQKAMADDVCQPWSWRTSAHVTKHLMALDLRGIKQTRSKRTPPPPQHWWERVKDPVTPTHYATCSEFLAAIDAGDVFGFGRCTGERAENDWADYWCDPGDQVWLPNPRLIGYGGREACSRKTHTYDRALIATNKPKCEQPRMPGTLWGEPERLRIPGTWTFLGAERHYSERWAFTSKKRRKARSVYPSFKEGWKLDRRENLTPLPPIAVRSVNGLKRGEAMLMRPARFNWKPDRQYYFGAWEQHRFVRRTRLPRATTAHLRRFTAQKRFFPYRVEVITTKSNTGGSSDG